MYKSLDRVSERRSLLSIGILFFVFGFFTWLNSILIPYFRIICEIGWFEAFLVTTAFYISYFLLAIPSAILLEKTSLIKGILLGLGLIVIGTLVFIPAALSRSFPIFLLGLFLQGAGLTLMQTASNLYVTLLGSIDSAAKRISLMGIANKIAGALGGLILGGVLFGDTKPQEIQNFLSQLGGSERINYLDQLAHSIISPYLIISILLIALMFIFYAMKPVETRAKTQKHKYSFKGIPKHSWLGFVAIFLYVGAEAIAGDSSVAYAQSTNLQPLLLCIGNFCIDFSTPHYFTSYVMTGMIIGYLLGIILIPKYISQEKMLKIFSIIGIIITIAILLLPTHLSVYTVPLLGFAHSIMWPCIWPIALRNADEKAEMVSALLIMGIIGGAILGPFFGWLCDKIDMQYAYSILIVSYLYLIFYSRVGERVRQSETN